VFSIGCIGTDCRRSEARIGDAPLDWPRILLGRHGLTACRAVEVDCLNAPAADRIRFVLVEPSHPGNIGAAARAVRTMGFRRLAVVAPREPDFRRHDEARAFATHAADVLDAASVHETLDQALEGVRLSFAMTGYAREFGPPLVDLRTAVSRARAHVDGEPGDVAFVFGTERNGLANDDVERCSACCAIAADAQAASLNLAQAVQVAAYECRLALVGGAIEARLTPFEVDPPASHDHIEGMFAHLEQALVALGYLDPAQPKRLMSRLRRLLARAQPSDAEVDILRGIAAAIVERRSERIGRKGGR
jgi:tRNA/rRNA methyltransferase